MDNQIMAWIEEYQRGRSGIYPYRVAQEIAARFGVSISAAILYVIRHIQEVMALRLEFEPT